MCEPISPCSPRAPFQEPLNPTKPAWERAGMTKEEYDSYLVRMKLRMTKWKEEQMRSFHEADAKSPNFWLARLSLLEMQRRPFMKQAGWSAEDMDTVFKIDRAIQECEEQIALLEKMEEDEDHLDGEIV